MKVEYQVFESFEDNAAHEYQLPPACPTAQSRKLVPISLENPVHIKKVDLCLHHFRKCNVSIDDEFVGPIMI